MKKLFRVSFCYEEIGKTDVLAENEKQAEEMVKLELEEEGVESLNYECNDRNYSVVGVEDITEK